MRLLFLSQLFDPEYSIKGITFLSALRDRGFDIQVITTFPNYPMGKIYPGYKLRMWEIEVKNNIKIVRVYSLITQSKSKFFRALSYSSFMISALIAMCFLRKPDVVYAYHPQITTGLIASIYGAVRGVPFITDVQDLWPDALLATGTTTSRQLVAAVASLCNLVYRRAYSSAFDWIQGGASRSWCFS
jgi:colanic acid biosynthesis glycosyl transferase WcaI